MAQEPTPLQNNKKYHINFDMENEKIKALIPEDQLWLYSILKDQRNALLSILIMFSVFMLVVMVSFVILISRI